MARQTANTSLNWDIEDFLRELATCFNSEYMESAGFGESSIGCVFRVGRGKLQSRPEDADSIGMGTIG